ncbi:hypothetical protein KM043_008931 [Ampulex compressa]|nr:hypothetical protein KM043_008931 [Ampulex compressa]
MISVAAIIQQGPASGASICMQNAPRRKDRRTSDTVPSCALLVGLSSAALLAALPASTLSISRIFDLSFSTPEGGPSEKNRYASTKNQFPSFGAVYELPAGDTARVFLTELLGKPYPHSRKLPRHKDRTTSEFAHDKSKRVAA